MRVSIVTPSFNQRDFIAQTIDSVVSQQGNFELEYLVMDGGSTDGTVELLKEKERQIKAGQGVGPKGGVSFIWQSQKDNGQSDAINQGMKRSTGDIIAYLNSDDLYLPGALKKVVDALANQPSKHWLYGRCQMIDTQGRPARGLITGYKNWLLKNFSRRKLLITNFISQPATFWTRTAYQKIGGFDENQHLVMDYDYWCKLSRLGAPIVLNDDLAAFRVHPNNKSSQNFIRQFNDQYQVAAANTGNGLILLLHRLHNFLITSVYRVIS
jgi:glycosyltransferase involved in cell wall biosynthesis